jgi:hypothetical protein
LREKKLYATDKEQLKEPLEILLTHNGMQLVFLVLQHKTGLIIILGLMKVNGGMEFLRNLALFGG